MTDSSADLQFTLPDAATVTERLRTFGGGRGIAQLDPLLQDLGNRLGGKTWHPGNVVMAFTLAIHDFFAATQQPPVVHTLVTVAVPRWMRRLIDNEEFLAQTLSDWQATRPR